MSTYHPISDEIVTEIAIDTRVDKFEIFFEIYAIAVAIE